MDSRSLLLLGFFVSIVEIVRRVLKKRVVWHRPLFPIFIPQNPSASLLKDKILRAEMHLRNVDSVGAFYCIYREFEFDTKDKFVLASKLRRAIVRYEKELGLIQSFESEQTERRERMLLNLSVAFYVLLIAIYWSRPLVVVPSSRVIPVPLYFFDRYDPTFPRHNASCYH